jgi:hypothetical protein
VTRYGGDPRAFLCLGLNFSHPAGLASAPRTSPWGYDGQFFAVLATDPLVLDPATAESLDAPSYRSRRILLPLVAWLVTLGRDSAAPFAYLVLCWGFGLAGVGLLAIWLERAGRSPWLALLYAASGGVVVSFLRATPDAAVTALVLAGLWAARTGRDRSALAALTAAALARETAVLAAVALAAVAGSRSRWHTALLLAVAVLSALAGVLLAKIELVPVVPVLTDLKDLAATLLRRCC